MEPVDQDQEHLPELVKDDKYIVFKRDEFLEHLGNDPTFKDLIVRDAVVIRRQDFFASAALATYANSIALVGQTTPDEVLARRLTNVADYFHQQSEAAAEQGYKFPD